MSYVTDEMKSYYGISKDSDAIKHYGIKKRSGRYPWGSGDDPYQHGRDFIGRIEELKNQGWTETPENIKKEFGMTTTEYRNEKRLASNERRRLKVETARALKEDGLNVSEIGRKMGINESSVRSLLDSKSEKRMNQAQKTADFLKDQIKSKGMIDVGVGVERELGVSKEKLKEAITILEKEGYPIYKGGVPQVTNPGKQINRIVACPPGTQHKEIYNYDQVHSVTDYASHDGGETFDKLSYPKSMSSKRLAIRYAEDGGIDKDGLVEIRRGVPDLSLGNDHYSQVRILVDDKKYIKGMAVYSDNLPNGVDIMFNTNKKKGTPKLDVLKDIKDDPDNPFGALIKANGQSYYTDEKGNKQLSLINKTRGEGDWDEWQNAIPSQFLSKQTKTLAEKQIKLSIADRQAEYDEIMSLTNPTIKKNLLMSFANDCDAASVNLKAASLPGQHYHVIIPIPSMKDNEIFAPRYENGTKLALVRYPHGGTFEIPILTVNNKQAEARKVLNMDSIDAVGINAKVAGRLSGADFDGDTVMCIPTHDKNGRIRIASTKPLEELEGFDPKIYKADKVEKDSNGNITHAYRNGQEFKVMKNKGLEMGKISNLITDMTLQGATPDKLARAVKHSMVVIDAEKHHLDYMQSEIDNDIASLRKEYQAHVDKDGTVRYGGAATLISKAKSPEYVDKRQGTPKINIKGKSWYDPSKPEGSLLYKTSDKLYNTYTKTDPVTGKTVITKQKRQTRSTKMAETDDAYSLISEANTPMERLYADYANKLKSMANQARKEYMTTPGLKYSAAAKATYKEEVSSLNAKLNQSLLNAPKERQANALAASEIKRKKKEAEAEGKTYTNSEIKKMSNVALNKYRAELGAKRTPIEITDREWEAIQAGAISENTLSKILTNTDADKLRQRATPKQFSTLSKAKVNMVKAMSASNYSLQEIANKLHISTSSVSKYLKGAN